MTVMNLYQIITGFLSGIVMFTFSILLGILIHELGHLIMGFLSGYHFSSFCCLGITLYKTCGRYKLTTVNRCPGQVIMYPYSLGANPNLLIAGGITGNVLAASVGFLMFFAMKDCTGEFTTVIRALFFAVVNLSLGLTNYLGRSKTCDGATLTEVKASMANRQCYNRLMLIAKERLLGNELNELPEELFYHPAGNTSSLAKELDELYLLRIMEGEA